MWWQKKFILWLDILRWPVALLLMIFALWQEQVKKFRAFLQPLRETLGQQSFVGGDQPNYGDYCIASICITGKTISKLKVTAFHCKRSWSRASETLKSEHTSYQSSRHWWQHEPPCKSEGRRLSVSHRLISSMLTNPALCLQVCLLNSCWVWNAHAASGEGRCCRSMARQGVEQIWGWPQRSCVGIIAV